MLVLKKNLHLLLSACILLIVAIVYGFNIFSILDNLLLLPARTVDLSNILKAIMGIYLGMASFWIIGIAKPILWHAATISNILFMGGLVLGRSISLLTDGKPSLIFVIGMLGELLLAIIGIYYLQKFKAPSVKNDKL